jgi:hypothetical protein
MQHHDKTAMPTKLGIPKDGGIDTSKELEEYITNLNIKNPHDQFETTTSKWRKITIDVNLNKHSPLPLKQHSVQRQVGSCVWGFLIRLFGYMIGIGHNTKY